MKSEIKALILLGVGVGLVVLSALIFKDCNRQQEMVTGFGMILGFWGAITLLYSGSKTKH
jgi:hypothetical protein